MLPRELKKLSKVKKKKGVKFKIFKKIIYFSLEGEQRIQDVADKIPVQRGHADTQLYRSHRPPTDRSLSVSAVPHASLPRSSPSAFTRVAAWSAHFTVPEPAALHGSQATGSAPWRVPDFGDHRLKRLGPPPPNLCTPSLTFQRPASSFGYRYRL